MWCSLPMLCSLDLFIHRTSSARCDLPATYTCFPCHADATSFSDHWQRYQSLRGRMGRTKRLSNPWHIQNIGGCRSPGCEQACRWCPLRFYLCYFSDLSQTTLLSMTEYGGLGLDYSFAVAIAEELGNVKCGALPMAISIQTDMATPALAKWVDIRMP